MFSFIDDSGRPLGLPHSLPRGLPHGIICQPLPIRELQATSAMPHEVLPADNRQALEALLPPQTAATACVDITNQDTAFTATQDELWRQPSQEDAHKALAPTVPDEDAIIMEFLDALDKPCPHDKESLLVHVTLAPNAPAHVLAPHAGSSCYDANHQHATPLSAIESILGPAWALHTANADHDTPAQAQLPIPDAGDGDEALATSHIAIPFACSQIVQPASPELATAIARDNATLRALIANSTSADCQTEDYVILTFFAGLEANIFADEVRSLTHMTIKAEFAALDNCESGEGFPPMPMLPIVEADHEHSVDANKPSMPSLTSVEADLSDQMDEITVLATTFVATPSRYDVRAATHHGATFVAAVHIKGGQSHAKMIEVTLDGNLRLLANKVIKRMH